MKNGELFFRLFLFNLIIIVPTAICVFTADFIEGLKTLAVILFIFLLVLLIIADILLYIKNEFDKEIYKKINDEYR
jgi:uncharacterized membrane protein YhaH (DUF805 family)